MNYRTTKKLRVAVLCREGLVPPYTTEGLTEAEIQPFKTEYDVISTLEGMGHEVQAVGLYSDVGVIRRMLFEFKPHVAFNLLEEFHGEPLYEQHVVSYLELAKQPYTGCNPRGLTVAHDKALSKKILAYHRISVPKFAVYPLNRKPRRMPKRLSFPLLVKSLSAEGSTGISQASIVHDTEKLTERIEFIHRQVQTDAIVEQFIDGREIYMAVVGNQRLQTFSPWELTVKHLPEGAPLIATGKLKWDYAYQQRVGVETAAAELPPELKRRFATLSKRIYRILGLTGYARLDFRLTADGRIYLLEANPNPNIAYGEDFAEAAEHAGLEYPPLLQKILNLGLNYSKTH